MVVAGAFSFLMAANGYDVFGFEAFIPNFRHLQVPQAAPSLVPTRRALPVDDIVKDMRIHAYRHVYRL